MYLVYGGFLGALRRYYFRKILNSLGNEKPRILDYGCGPGDLLMLGRELEIEMVGIDSDERSVDLAQKRGLEVILGDERALCKVAGKFDAIILQSVIEHISDPVSTLRSLVPLLNDDGVLIVSVPTPGPHFWDDPTHIRPFTPKAVLTVGELLGFRDCRVTYVFAYLLGINLSSAIIFKILNIFSFPLGSNLVAFFKNHE